MGDDIPSDLDSLRWRSQTGAIVDLESAKPDVRRRRQRPFVRGPIPLEWLGHAASLGGKCLNVAIAIKFLQGMSGGVPFKLTTAAMDAMGVSRQAGYKALSKLEAGGLVIVERKNGTLPRITVLEVT